MLIKDIGVVTMLGAAVALSGCSGGGAPAQQPAGEVTVSTPPDETPTPVETQSLDFAPAVMVTRLAHQSKSFRLDLDDLIGR